MREMKIIFPGDTWDDEAEVEELEAQVVDALDSAGIDYTDVSIA
jgi:hypothetical protein